MIEEELAQAVEAMRERRAELIAKPLERIYGELALAALPIIERAVRREALREAIARVEVWSSEAFWATGKWSDKQKVLDARVTAAWIAADIRDLINDA